MTHRSQRKRPYEDLRPALARLAPPAPQCHKIRDDLALVALGLLSGPEQTVVLHHIQHCSSCRRELHSLARVARELRRFQSSMDPKQLQLPPRE
jgi:predicted anti-sigma-YlaC factor YlaD